MSQDDFDRLTRQLGTPISRRRMLKLIVGAAAGSVAAWLGGGVTPAGATEACTFVLSDGTCQPGTQKKTNPNNTPSYNGCGPEGGSVTIPQGFGSASYTQACNNHDICYEDCFKPKSQCDNDFYKDMVLSCSSAYPGTLQTLHRTYCYDFAYIYYQAVSKGGADAWAAGQIKACKCCWDQKVYCACNKTCYDDVNVCLSQCHTGLGCFTGICGPAQPDQCPTP